MDYMIHKFEMSDDENEPSSLELIAVGYRLRATMGYMM